MTDYIELERLGFVFHDGERYRLTLKGERFLSKHRTVNDPPPVVKKKPKAPPVDQLALPIEPERQAINYRLDPGAHEWLAEWDRRKAEKKARKRARAA